MSAFKISILTHDIGGAFTNLCVSLVRGFQKLGVNCNLVVLDAIDEDLARYSGIPIITSNLKRTTVSLLVTVRYLQEYQSDVILPMPWYFNIVAIWGRNLAAVRTKVIVDEHNIISLEAGIEHRNNHISGFCRF